MDEFNADEFKAMVQHMNFPNMNVAYSWLNYARDAYATTGKVQAAELMDFLMNEIHRVWDARRGALWEPEPWPTKR